MMSSELLRKRTSKRQAGSEGLRVFALLGVCAFHIRPDIVPAGFLGVVIFFVLAGFYTTRSFVVRKTVRLQHYYTRRITRLFPPILFLCTVLALFSGFIIPEVFVFLKQSAPSSLLGFNNIAQILADHSYFNRHGQFDPLTHLWALSLEMQFYLIFPLIYMALSGIADLLPPRIRRYGREGAGIFLLLLGAASAFYMYYLYNPNPAVDPTAVYYGSLVRAHAFLNGAAANLIVAGRQMRFAFAGRERRKLPTWLRCLWSWLALIAMIASYFIFSWRSRFLFEGGFYLYSLLAVSFIIMGGVKPVPGMGFMNLGLFRWLASRSYAIYLWQYSLMVVIEAALRFSKVGFWPRLGLQLVLLVIMSEISWRLFEEGGRIREGFRGMLAVFLAFIFTVMMILPPPVKPKAPALAGEDVLRAIRENDALQAAMSSQETAPSTAASTPAQTTPPSTAETTPAPTETTAPPETTPAVVYTAGNPYGYSEADCERLKNTNLVMIGDSVLAMAMDGMRAYIPTVHIDAKVSRHFFQGPDILASLDASGIRGDIIVIALATNGDLQVSDIGRYYEIAAGRPLIFVNTVVPGTWEQPNNQKLADFASSHQNVYIADWYAAAKNHPEYFYQDATHPIPNGAAVYDQVILETILRIPR